jgi:hypothetical protein
LYNSLPAPGSTRGGTVALNFVTTPIFVRRSRRGARSPTTTSTQNRFRVDPEMDAGRLRGVHLGEEERARVDAALAARR